MYVQGWTVRKYAPASLQSYIPVGNIVCARLHGCRRYDYMDVIGRVMSGTKTESNVWSSYQGAQKMYVCDFTNTALWSALINR